MKSYARQAFAQVAFSGIAKGFLFVVFILLFKQLSKPEMGAFAIAYSISAVLAIISEAGLRGLLLRELPRNENNLDVCQCLIQQAQSARLALFPIYLGIVFILGQLLLPTGSGILLLFLAFAGWFESNSNLLRGILRSFYYFITDGFLAAGFKVFLLISISLLAWKNLLTPANIAISFAGCALAETVATHIFTNRLTGLSPWPVYKNLNAWLPLVRRALPFTVLSVVGLIYLRTGLFFLGLPKTEHALQEAAGYSLAARIPEGIMFLPLALMNVAIPYFSRHFSQRTLITEKLWHFERLFGVASILIAVGMVILSKPLILGLAVPDYLAYEKVFQLYALAIPFTFLQYLYSNLLIAGQMESVVARRHTFILIINVILNLALVGSYGAKGAVIALLASEVAGLGIDLYYMRKLKIHPSITSLAIWIGVLLGAAVIAWLCLNLETPWSLIIYGIFCALVGLATFLLSDKCFVRKTSPVEPG